MEGVEPTNNHAERTLRRAAIWRKVSFGNHSDADCRFAERLPTMVQTLRLQHHPVLDYSASGEPSSPTAPPAPPPFYVLSGCERLPLKKVVSLETCAGRRQ